MRRQRQRLFSRLPLLEPLESRTLLSYNVMIAGATLNGAFDTSLAGIAVFHPTGNDATVDATVIAGYLDAGKTVQITTDRGMATIRDKTGHCLHGFFTMTPMAGSPSP
jgi:hypothetical protein